MTQIVIDSEDPELFIMVKQSVDSLDDEVDEELFHMLRKKHRLIRYTHFPGRDKVYIDFPVEKRSLFRF